MSFSVRSLGQVRDMGWNVQTPKFSVRSDLRVELSLGGWAKQRPETALFLFMDSGARQLRVFTIIIMTYCSRWQVASPDHLTMYIDSSSYSRPRPFSCHLHVLMC
jgi:hypothetical protein